MMLACHSTLQMPGNKLKKKKNIAPLLEDYYIALCGSGAPSHMMTRLKRTIDNYKDILIVFGGFHLGLMGWRGPGSLFGGACSRAFSS
jgi:hypothetical protein